MATHSIGKLKFNLSGQGLSYRWGDGKVQRLGAIFGENSVRMLGVNKLPLTGIALRLPTQPNPPLRPS